MSKTWKVEMHSHTLWSMDSIVEFETIIEVCQQRGIDRIMITDHNTVEGALKFHALAPDLVIPGEEIMTSKGELLAYFVKETVPRGLTPEESIRRLRDQGAFISVSHPFDQFRKGAWDEAELIEIIDQVDAIETYNGRCLIGGDNTRAQVFAEEHHLPGTIGSDAHTRSEYGLCYAEMRPFEYTRDDFLDALRGAKHVGQLSPWGVHLGTTYAKWSKKLGFKPRMWPGG